MFNDELDVLELRLTYMNPYVDRFVIGECLLTYSNLTKPLHFKNNRERFSKFKDKIIYVEVPLSAQKDGWEGEFFQRDYLKHALETCNDDDIIIIADVDEFVNLEYVLGQIEVKRPLLLEMSMYYYFLNLKTPIRWLRTLITPYSYIKNFNIGDRLKYTKLNPMTLTPSETPLGWHFSYAFGWNLDLYISKLQSFSHQEYNSPYFLDRKRIRTCLSLGIDFLERYSIYEQVNLKDEVTPALYNAIKNTMVLDRCEYKQPKISFYLNVYHIKYYLKFILKLKLKTQINRLLGGKK
jgi:beta-1,4-mannosyl-glycoprotein beta-1,4-N-acetylglucosaminyltransferase